MKRKVLIIDDSAFIREILTQIINASNDFTVVGTAADPYIAAEKIVKLEPDLITLDIEMPRMDGITFLEKLMRTRPIPVLIVSSLAKHNSETTLKALELGAVDYVLKPSTNIKECLSELSSEIHKKLLAAAFVKVSPPSVSREEIERKYARSSKVTKSDTRINFQTTDKVIAIGASTGGTVALAKLLSQLPVNLPGIVIVQHMPPGFTKSFADRLNNECEMFVKEAEDHDSIIAGQVLLAPGAKHMVVDRSGARYFVRIIDTAPVNNCKPSVDVLFKSVAEIVGQNAVGIILTGMGDDGARGMLEMKRAGAFNIAQDETSSLIFGMPKVAIEMGGVDDIMDLGNIPTALQKFSI